MTKPPIIEGPSSTENTIAIIDNLDLMLARRKLRSHGLAERIGSTEPNLSLRKGGQACGVRFEPLPRFCQVLHCQPGGRLARQPGPQDRPAPTGPAG